MDQYQARYLAHRHRKAAMIAQDPASCGAPTGRRSVRAFENREVPQSVLEQIFEAARMAPQSCNRQAMTLKVVKGVDAGGWLAGGVGWAEKAPVIVLVFADLAAYKGPSEVAFMPWLDAGVILASLVYAAASHGVGSCIINPYMRPERDLGFRALFNPRGRLFCGAVALGYSRVTPGMPEKKPLADLVEWTW